MKILCVEDNELFSKFIKTILKDENFEIDFVTSLAGAENRLKTSSVYSLILLDLNLDDSKGVSTLYKLRKINTKNVPIIILTANQDVEILSTCLLNGAEDVQVKPIMDKNNFIIKIKSIIRYSNETLKTKRDRHKIDNAIWKDISQYQ